MTQYPECEKQAAIIDKAQLCGEFLDWIHSQGWEIAHYEHRGDPEPGGNDYLVPVRMSIEQLLANFFSIDLAKIEDEQRAMLEELRAL